MADNMLERQYYDQGPYVLIILEYMRVYWEKKQRKKGILLLQDETNIDVNKFIL